MLSNAKSRISVLTQRFNPNLSTDQTSDLVKRQVHSGGKVNFLKDSGVLKVNLSKFFDQSNLPHMNQKMSLVNKKKITMIENLLSPRYDHRNPLHKDMNPYLIPAKDVFTMLRKHDEEVFRETYRSIEEHPYGHISDEINETYAGLKTLAQLTPFLREGRILVLGSYKCILEKECMYPDLEKSELILRNLGGHPVILKQDLLDPGYVIVSVQTTSPEPILEKLFGYSAEGFSSANSFAKDNTKLIFSGYAPMVQGMTKESLVYSSVWEERKNVDKEISSVNLVLGRVRYENLDKLITVEGKATTIAYPSSDLIQHVLKLQHDSAAYQMMEHQKEGLGSTRGTQCNMEQIPNLLKAQEKAVLENIPSILSLTNNLDVLAGKDPFANTKENG